MKTIPPFQHNAVRPLLLATALLVACATSTVHAQRGGGGRGSFAPSTGPVNTQVLAVADENSNSLIVAVPDTLLPMIEELVSRLDQPIADITELRVFFLRNADPQEMANLLTSLFPDETLNSSGNQMQFRFGGFGNRGGRGGRGGGNNNAANTPSERAKKQGRVLAVPDPRTSSVIVSAASELMPQIADMVTRLDSSPARKQKVFVYSLENADPLELRNILQEMFQTTTTANRNTANQNSALSTRIQSNNQQISTGQNMVGFGANGGIGLGGGGRGGQAFR